VTAIIATEFKRTQETAAPVAAARGISPQILSVRGTSVAEHVQAVAQAVQRQTGVILVVGHSNTVPAIIAALGAGQLPMICETDYDNLFVVARVGSEQKLVKSRYGAADKTELGASPCSAVGAPTPLH
jgi:broad specificity phosphatase PhoE